MVSRMIFWFGAAAFTALLAGPATAHAQICQIGEQNRRGIAILPPAESPDLPDRGIGTSNVLFHPYYSPVMPISMRWKARIYVPYYPGYCKSSVRKLPPGVAGGGWLAPQPDLAPGTPVVTGQGDFNGFTGAPRDEAYLLHLGGTGPYQPSVTGAHDLLDALHGAPRPQP